MTLAVGLWKVSAFYSAFKSILIRIFHLPRSAQAVHFSMLVHCYIVQIHWRLTYKTPGLEESIIAPLTLLLHPPLLAFLPSLINRPALGALLCSLSSLSVCVSCACVCGHCVYVYLHMRARTVSVCVCVCVQIYEICVSSLESDSFSLLICEI